MAFTIQDALYICNAPLTWDGKQRWYFIRKIWELCLKNIMDLYIVCVICKNMMVTIWYRCLDLSNWQYRIVGNKDLMCVFQHNNNDENIYRHSVLGLFLFLHHTSKHYNNSNIVGSTWKSKFTFLLNQPFACLANLNLLR